MQKPNIIALPTSQMMALCDVLGLGKEVQASTGSMISALEVADFSKLKVVKPPSEGPRPEGTIGFQPDTVAPDIVAARKARLGRT